MNRKTYTVQKGNTLSGIAKEHGTTVEAIMGANPSIKDPDKIQIGRKIELGANPRDTGAGLHEVNTLSETAEGYNGEPAVNKRNISPINFEFINRMSGTSIESQSSEKAENKTDNSIYFGSKISPEFRAKAIKVRRILELMLTIL